MTVAELPGRGERPTSPPRSTAPLRRTSRPSSASSAACCCRKDAIADVVEILRGDDFYKPAHQTIYEAILDLYGRGEPADAITVSAELTKRGELGRVGGAPYLHTLISSVPTAANAGYYARIVSERAILRRLVEAGTRIVQMGYADTGEVDEVVDRAQAEIYDVTERRTSEDYAPAGGDHGGHPRRDRGDRLPRRHDDRRPDRLHRPRRAHQRSAPGPADRRRGTSRSRQVHAGASTSRARLDQARTHQRDLLAGDDAQRDHDASAVGRGARRPAPHALRQRWATTTGPSWPAGWARSRARRSSSTTPRT